MQKKNIFLAKKAEDANLNQYWFSQATIEFLVDHIESLQPEKVAFLSTPSVYCSLKNKQLKEQARLFEFDEGLKKEKGFVFYDFNKPLEIPEEYHHYFDCILIDPPFITQEVWSKYAQTIKLLSKENAKLLCCSIMENDKMLESLIGVHQCTYKPSIPHLIYQYNFYANYEHEALSAINGEIGF